MEVSPLWKTEYLADYCITVVKIYCEKNGHYRRQACVIDVEEAVSLWECIF